MKKQEQTGRTDGGKEGFALLCFRNTGWFCWFYLLQEYKRTPERWLLSPNQMSGGGRGCGFVSVWCFWAAVQIDLLPSTKLLLPAVWDSDYCDCGENGLMEKRESIMNPRCRFVGNFDKIQKKINQWNPSDDDPRSFLLTKQQCFTQECVLVFGCSFVFLFLSQWNVHKWC